MGILVFMIFVALVGINAAVLGADSRRWEDRYGGKEG